jgi:hypothetical protein
MRETAPGFFMPAAQRLRTPGGAGRDAGSLRTHNNKETGFLMPAARLRHQRDCVRQGEQARRRLFQDSRRGGTHDLSSGQSGNPAGRPVGARGKATIMAEGIFEGEAEEIIRAAINQAKSGDVEAIRVSSTGYNALTYPKLIGF